MYVVCTSNVCICRISEEKKNSILYRKECLVKNIVVYSTWSKEELKEKHSQQIKVNDLSMVIHRRFVVFPHYCLSCVRTTVIKHISPTETFAVVVVVVVVGKKNPSIRMWVNIEYSTAKMVRKFGDLTAMSTTLETIWSYCFILRRMKWSGHALVMTYSIRDKNSIETSVLWLWWKWHLRRWKI